MDLKSLKKGNCYIKIDKQYTIYFKLDYIIENKKEGFINMLYKYKVAIDKNNFLYFDNNWSIYVPVIYNNLNDIKLIDTFQISKRNFYETIRSFNRRLSAQKRKIL